jgi:hypothetical protein
MIAGGMRAASIDGIEINGAASTANNDIGIMSSFGKHSPDSVLSILVEAAELADNC